MIILSKDIDIFKPAGGNPYREFNEKRFKSKEKLYAALLKMIPHPGQNWRNSPNTVVRTWLFGILDAKGANMKMIRSAYHGLEVYCLISRVVWRWQFDNNDEFICQNPLYPDKTNKVIQINDMCPRMKKRVRTGKMRPPPGYEDLVRRPWK